MAPRTLVLLHRDIRLVDNSALNAASGEVIPCFIFDPKQQNHAYFSPRAFIFLRRALRSLDDALRTKNLCLHLYEGAPEKILPRILAELSITHVVCNRDYTPFAIHRDMQLQKICEDLGVHFKIYADTLLHEPEECVKKDGRAYSIFTPFFRNACVLPVAKPAKGLQLHGLLCEKNSVYKKYLDVDPLHLFNTQDLGAQHMYATERDILHKDATTHLSAHLRFGTISVRQVYHALINAFKEGHALVRSLFWRDFFTHIAFYYPHIFGHAFHQKYDLLHWRNDPTTFAAWCEGKTGFPIIDAGMRELNATGYMHNRARMITASFLVKDLHLDWRWGEKYFATKLIDYDPCLNNGNWQWAASTGCDAQPYFRIFNPWSQQERFDPECLYIKKWIPELKPYTPKEIRMQEKNTLHGYMAPIVNHREASEQAKAMFTLRH